MEGNEMKQQDNLSFLNDIDEKITIKNKEKYQIEMELNELKKKRDEIDADLMKLQKDKWSYVKIQYKLK